jgi:SNF2 family DNA or RNA helicase
MMPTPFQSQLQCAGAITFNACWLTSKAVNLKHPFKSPVHLYVPNQQEKYPYIQVILPDGYCIGYIPKEFHSCFLHLLGTEGKEYKTRPAGGWKPSDPRQNFKTPAISCYLKTICSDQITQLQITALLFIRPWDKRDLKKIVSEHELPLQLPSDYNPREHYDVEINQIHLDSPPNWTVSYAGIHQLSKEAAFELQSVPSGTDLQPVEPSNIVTAQLLPHQKQGLAFLLDRENPHTTTYHALWVVRNVGDFKIWSHRLSSKEFIATSEHPAPFTPRASILADDMGLGKTLQTIALIATTLEASKTYEAHYTSCDFNTAPTGLHATLLVCPCGLIDTWKDEIIKHTRSGGLKVMTWYGPKRTSYSSELWKSADIIITTPTTLLHDLRFGQPRLPFITRWYRIVIDEAQ